MVSIPGCNSSDDKHVDQDGGGEYNNNIMSDSTDIHESNQSGPVESFLCSLVADQIVFAVGEPIAISYRMKNISSQPIIIWHSGFWPDHQLLLRDDNDIEVPLTPRGLQARSAFDPDGPRRKNIPVTLEPGQIDDTFDIPDLCQYFKIEQPGIYNLQCLYRYQKDALWSNKLILEIKSD